jgi:hypothetical protein
MLSTEEPFQYASLLHSSGNLAVWIIGTKPATDEGCRIRKSHTYVRTCHRREGGRLACCDRMATEAAAEEVGRSGFR